VGTVLQEATQVGSSAHQDTDINGNFSFAGGYTCPANAYVYIVAYGGNTGANANNPNSLLMAALGSCATLDPSGTSYTGPSIWVDELTTVAAAYALNNFMTITGNASTGYTVGIGTDATNSAAPRAGCVVNSYFPGCTAANATGLADAFATAISLVNTGTGAVNATNGNSGVIPVQFINALGNIVQACVNSTGGGTNSSGAPTAATSSATGITFDSTVCGAFFAYTSYTLNGTPSGTLVTAGNTLQALMNLAKHPAGISGGTLTTNGSAQPFTTCTSGGNQTGTGTISAATCLYNLTPATNFYSGLTAAPPDWTLSVTYPKGTLSSATNTTACNTTTPANNGLYYPWMLATDINDNIAILNQDSGNGYCYNVITMANSGALIGASPLVNSGATVVKLAPIWISTDPYGHAIVPIQGTSGTASTSSIAIYTAAASDGNPSLVQTIGNGSNGANLCTCALLPYFTGVDANGNIFLTDHGAINDQGFITLSTASHNTPGYTGGVAGTAYTGTMENGSMDFDNNFISMAYGGASVYVDVAGGTANPHGSGGTEVNNGYNNDTVMADTLGDIWALGPDSTSAPTKWIASKFTYSAAAPTTVTAATQAATFTPAPSTGTNQGTIDGANVIWLVDAGVTTATNPGYIRSYDTVNNVASAELIGCRMPTATSTVCNNTATGSSGSEIAPFVGPRGVAVDASGNLWVASAYNGTVSEAIGLATPTWPLYVHNGTSNKP
jgi:hypothetical protein